MMNELKTVFTKKLLIISLIAVMFLPVIYSASFLTSMWDPYGKTEALPIAVVNEDQAAELNGETIELGKEVEDELAGNDSFEWHFVSAENAKTGVERGDYYAVITMASDFSENAASLLSSEPKQITLDVTTNPGYSYSGKSIADKSALAVEDAVASEVRELYTKKVFTTVNELNDGYVKASDATLELNQGSLELEDSIGQLTGGMSALAAQTPPVISTELEN